MANYETALEQQDTTTLSDPEINVTELRDFAFVVLRIHPETEGAVQAFKQLGLEFPQALGMTAVAEKRWVVKWISPDEYLVTLLREDKADFIQQATAAFDGLFAAVVDNSGGYSLLRIAGSHYHDVLSKLCFYDLKNRLPVGKVVSTALAQSPAIFYRTEEDSVLCMLRWSFADYAWKTLLTASEEYR